MRAGAMTWIALIAAGCVLAPVDLEGRPCPCGEGWVCVAGICERDQRPETDAGRLGDGGLDAAPGDAALDGDIGLDASADASGDAGTDAGGEPPDAGPDAGPVDAGPDLTRCDDLHRGALFCDGFEWEYPAGRIGWTFEQVVGGTLTTSTSPAPFFGERSLRAGITTINQRASIGHTLPTAVIDGDLWLRAFYYFPSGASVEGMSLLHVGTADRGTGIVLQTRSEGRLGTWIGTAGGTNLTSNVPVPRDRWVCLQLHVVIADTGGEVNLYLDDVRVARFAPYDTLPLSDGGYRTLQAGIEYSFSPQTAATIHVDEVVLSRTRVPCE